MNLLLSHPGIYTKGDPSVWKGRIDGQERDWMRWHQLMDCVDLLQQPELQRSIAFLGFCSDEGVWPGIKAA